MINYATNEYKDDIPECIESCSLVQEFLDTVVSFPADEAFKNSYKNLDISSVESTFEEAIRIIFNNIITSIDNGKFECVVPLGNLCLSETSHYKMIKYLEKLGYEALLWSDDYTLEISWINN